jgi:hypothetical protein
LPKHLQNEHPKVRIHQYREILVQDAPPFDIQMNNIPKNFGGYGSYKLGIPYLSPYEGT